MRSCIGLLLVAFIAGLASAQPSSRGAAASSASTAPAHPRPERLAQLIDPLDKPVAQAVNFLLSQITTSGSCASEFPAGNTRFGGKTALCVYALLSAEADYRDPAVVRAVDWLMQQKLTGTYAVAMRACALGTHYRISQDARLAPAIRADVQWLIDACDKDGGYTYASAGGKDRSAYDNSNSQVAVLGIWVGASAIDMETPATFWQKIERHWVTQQQADGGWGYLVPKGEVRTKSYGSMTAAGLATLYICYDNLNRDLFVRCAAAPEGRAVTAAQKWLGDHFDPADNPGKGVEWYFYWLYSLERVGQAGGEKYIGGHDWFARGLSELMTQQDSAGSFGAADPVTETAFAVMFLVRGRHPMLLNKLNYGGKWNSRPHDAANFAQWWSYTFERHVRWQAVRLDAAAADLRDAPILYISGSGAIELSDKQIDTLRQYVYEGGTIVSEAAGNNADFSLDMAKIYKKLFPQYELTRPPGTHALYRLNFAPGFDAGLTVVSNGPRLLAVHASNELSLGLQIGPTKTFTPVFEQMANICLYVTDRGSLRPRTQSPWPKAEPFTPRATVRVTRVRYDGNYNPEPLALERLAILMGNRQKVKLDIAEPTDLAALDAAKQPIAIMTGSADFKLSAKEKAALGKYFADGGTLIVDSAGGAKAFADAVEREVFPLVPDGTSGEIATEHPIYAGVKIAYRRELSAAMSERDRTRGRLRGVQDDKRLVVIFSPEDITAGLVGYPFYGIRGYSPETSVNLMTNMLMYAAKVK